jgi:large subunit ribosomal protein L18
MKRKEEGRKRRRRRIRRKVHGTDTRGRLAVFRSHVHIYAQIVDDTQGQTLVSASSLRMQEVTPSNGETRLVAQARAVGQMLAERAKEKGIAAVIFDRSGYRYHGRVAALARGARDNGLKF